MKNLLIRGITGAVYVGLVIGSTLLGKFTFFAFFVSVLAYTLYEFYRLCKKGGNKPQMTLGIVASIYLFVAFFLYDFKLVGPLAFLGIIPLLILSPTIELFKQSKKPIKNIAFTLIGIVYIALPFSVLNFIVTPYESSTAEYIPEILIGLFFILWANDSGAYMIGSLIGKTKMLERISPNKTWEGALGGAITAVIIGLVFFHFIGFLSPLHVIIVSLLTVIGGTIGDLTESMIKRSFKVKDSGKIMPGHGGLLDRFDSMLFAAPIYFVYIALVLN